jgi:hemolysin III
MYHGERFNSITHLAGTLLAIVGAIVLLAQAAVTSNIWKLLSAGVFSISLIALYAASTLYHGTRSHIKQLFAKLDHCAIFLLIAATYTPLCLVTLHGPVGWTLLTVVWGGAAWGIARELRYAGDASPATFIYLLMGWVGIGAIHPLTEQLDQLGILWFGAGALLYSVGVVFYKLGARWRHSHGVWHLFVLAGSSSHYYAVLNFVIE